MSQNLTSAMATALQQPTTYLCRIWQITLVNGDVYTFTDTNRDIVSLGVTFVYDPGIKVSAIAAATTGRDNNASATIREATAFLSLAEVRQGALDNAEFSLWLIDWRDPDHYGRVERFAGMVSHVSFKDKGYITLELTGDIRNGGNTRIGEVYSRTCRALLGDNRCKVDLDAMAVDFTVTNVTDGGYTVHAAALVGTATDYYKFGRITWLTGANTGHGDEIKTSDVAGTATLMYTPRNVVSVGDTGKITPGCDKAVETCGNKFNNLLNFRGEPYVLDQVFSGNFPVTELNDGLDGLPIAG